MWNDIRPRIARQHPPRTGDTVVREPLVSKLAEATQLPLTVIVAGQGYGKTRLLSQLATSHPEIRLCWLRLEVLVAPIAVTFVSSLIESVRVQYPRFGQSFPKFPHIPLESASEVDAAAAIFVKEVDAHVRRRMLLVIEDLHMVDSSGQISLFISRLVEEAHPNLGIVLTSRTSPRLPVPSFVARGKAQLLGEDDLRFDADDVRSAFQKTSQCVDVAEVLRVSEGRASVVMALVRAMGDAGEAERAEFLAECEHATCKATFPIEFLLRHMPGSSRDVLIRASILDVVDEEAAVGLSGNPLAAQVLAALCETDSLEPAVDGDRVLYVWQPDALVALALERQTLLSGAELSNLRMEAARMHLKRGNRSESARMLLLAGDTESALPLLADELPAVMRALRIREADELLSLIPPDALVGNYGLLMLLGELRRRQGRLSEAMDVYDKAAMAAEEAGHVHLRVEALHSFATTSLEVRGSDEARSRVVADLERIDTPDAVMNSALVRSCMHFLAEDFIMAYRTALSAVSRATQEEVHYPDCLSFLISVGLARGELREAEKILAREVAVRRARGEISSISEMLGIGNSIWLVCVCLYSLGDADGLEGLLGQVMPGEGLSLPPEMTAVFRMVRALCAIVRGNYDDALKWLRACAPLVTTEKRLNAFSFNDEASFILRRELAHVYLARRDSRHARACVYHNLECPLVVLGRTEYGMLTKMDLAEYLIVDGKPSEALPILEETLTFQRRSGRALEELRSLALRARALVSLGSDEKAVSSVKDALVVAIPRGLYYAAVRELRHQECLPLLAQVLAQPAQNGELCMFLEEALTVHAPAILRRLHEGLLPRATAKPQKRQRTVKPVMVAGGSDVTVRTFGGMHVAINGETADRWRKHKARALFALLLVSEGRALSKDYLADLLWQEADPYAARNSLRNTVCALRSALGAESTGKLVQSNRDSLWLAYDRQMWDVPKFSDIVGAIRRLENSATHGDPMSHLASLKSVYVGDFLPESVFGDLFTEKRHKYREDYCDCLCILADVALFRGMDGVAVQCYHDALEVDDCMERAHLGLMKAFSSMGDREAAIRQYRACQDRLRSVLGVTPDRGTVEFFESMVGLGATLHSGGTRLLISAGAGQAG